MLNLKRFTECILTLDVDPEVAGDKNIFDYFPNIVYVHMAGYIRDDRMTHHGGLIENPSVCGNLVNESVSLYFA